MPKKIMPQEIEVWYLIPALRRELARLFVSKSEYGLSQKRAAEILGISEAAISQYLKEKRGGSISFSGKEMAVVKSSAGRIVAKPESVMKEIYGLCTRFRKSKVICDIHKLQDKSIPDGCKVCFEN